MEPLALLALTAVGAVAGIWRRQRFVIASAIVCIAFPAYQAISDARALNGYRHFIFLVPFLMLVAAPLLTFGQPLLAWIWTLRDTARQRVAQMFRETAPALSMLDIYYSWLYPHRLE